MEGRPLPATKGLPKWGLSKSDSNELTDAECTAMQAGAHQQRYCGAGALPGGLGALSEASLAEAAARDNT
jgi:hypothetical protein